jgi:hypothetical protein
MRFALNRRTCITIPFNNHEVELCATTRCRSNVSLCMYKTTSSQPNLGILHDYELSFMHSLYPHEFGKSNE